MTDDGSVCLLCGDPVELSIHDIWTDGNFQLSTCCAGLLEQVSAEIDADPAWARALLRQLGAEELTGHVLRRVSDGESNGPVLDFKLRLAPVSFSVARAFIARHHRHCGPPLAWRFGAAVLNGSALMGVVSAGNPVAPALNGRGIIEVNRLCIRGDLNPMLRWNCCSKLYAHAASEWQEHRDREAELLPLNKAALFEALSAGGISSVVVSFDGSGDSGQIEDVTACTSDGDQMELPTGTVAYQEVRFDAAEPTLTVVPVRNVLEHLAYELLGQSHGGWENDDGAYGEFTFDVAAGSITLAYNERYVETHYHEHEF